MNGCEIFSVLSKPQQLTLLCSHWHALLTANVRRTSATAKQSCLLRFVFIRTCSQLGFAKVCLQVQWKPVLSHLKHKPGQQDCLCQATFEYMYVIMKAGSATTTLKTAKSLSDVSLAPFCLRPAKQLCLYNPTISWISWDAYVQPANILISGPGWEAQRSTKTSNKRTSSCEMSSFLLPSAFD